MPLTPKGNKIMQAMKTEYGDKRGESVFYASRNKGTISGVEAVNKLRRAGRGLKEAMRRQRKG